MPNDKFYEMREHRDEFFSLNLPIDDTYSFVVVSNNNPFHLREYNHDIKYICKSINDILPDWQSPPSIEQAIKRLNTISSLFLFYHREYRKPIGWGWFSNVFTYNWIDKVHELPTNNAAYFGGTYITKDKKIPRAAGLQLYIQAFNYLLTHNEWLYGYMDSWNKAPIKICHKLGGSKYDFIKEYKDV